MIKKSGDLFSTRNIALGHGVNCKGVMGAGIAKAFRDKFPENYSVYKSYCNLKVLRPGGFLPVQDRGRFIYNIASQYRPGADARYEWLFDGCKAAAEHAVSIEVDSIAIPLIGCGIGGLEWQGVETCLLAIETLVPNFEFEVWKFE